MFSDFLLPLIVAVVALLTGIAIFALCRKGPAGDDEDFLDRQF